VGVMNILDKKYRKFLFIGVVLFGCIICSVAALIYSVTPAGKASATEHALADIATQTEKARPTSTPLPTNTSIPTSTPFPFDNPLSTIKPLPTYTLVPTKTPLLSLTQTIQPLPSVPLMVHFIDVGQGDSILIQAPGGELGLIDGGEADSGVVQYLQRLGIAHLNLIIATHPHSDHIGGLVQVLNAIPVDKVITNGVSCTTLTYEHFLDAIMASQAEYVEAKRGDTITLGALDFNVLSPVDNTDQDLNDGSLVLKLVYDRVSFLFTGDAQTTAEDSMLAAGLDVSATILKVAHHGSRTGSPLSFLTAVRPEVAIYSAGAGNDFGHPHPETIEALKTVGAKIYGTDINGTIIVTTDGVLYSISTTKKVPTQTPISVQPTAQPPSVLFINVVSLTSPINAGAYASLTINTLPGAACTITVYYKSGPSQAAGLGPQTAGSDGNVTWSWKVGSRTSAGTWKIVVTASLNGQSKSINIPFEVR
jgi:beta-lactamase superfamily II metal-dependent hydrolase